MLLVANLANTKKLKITVTLANGYSSESSQRELSNVYQNDRVSMVFKNLCVLMLWTKVASALEGLTPRMHCSALGYKVTALPHVTRPWFIVSA